MRRVAGTAGGRICGLGIIHFACAGRAGRIGIGLAILGMVAWSAVASHMKSAVVATHGRTCRRRRRRRWGITRWPTDSDVGYLMAAGISGLAALIALVMVRHGI